MQRQANAHVRAKTALAAKVDRLDREFEHLRSTTSAVAWCDRLWWQPGSRRMSEDKWSSVDAWYRSRSLSFVWAGDAMVPCIDMANHAGDGSRNAYFDRDVAGRALLRLAPRQRLKRGDEVTISYGDTKSAAEMLFSYGFIEPDTTRTGAVTLDLPVPDDDPLKQAKEAASSTVAAVRISWAADVSSTLWETSSVWLICVNEEDGLRFSVVPGADGEPVLTVAWQGHDLTHDMRDLEALLRRDDRWPLYELRAIVTVLERVQLQLRRLDVSAPEVADANATIDEGEGQAASAARAAALRLRELEQDLLEQSRRDLEQQLLERSHVNIADMAAPPRDE